MYEKLQEIDPTPGDSIYQFSNIFQNIDEKFQVHLSSSVPGTIEQDFLKLGAFRKLSQVTLMLNQTFILS